MLPFSSRTAAWLGVAGPALMFVGDLLLFPELSGGQATRDTMAKQLAEVSGLRLYIGSVLGPLAASLYLVGYINIYQHLRKAQPRAALVFLICAAQTCFLSAAFHAVFGTLGDALRSHAPQATAVDYQILLRPMIDGNLSALGLCNFLCSLGYFGILVYAVLKRHLPIPRWFLLLNPLTTMAATEAGTALPAPIGGIIVAGGWNLGYVAFFGIAARYLSRDDDSTA